MTPLSAMLFHHFRVLLQELLVEIEALTAPAGVTQPAPPVPAPEAKEFEREPPESFEPAREGEGAREPHDPNSPIAGLLDTLALEVQEL